MNDSMVFYRSFYESIRGLPVDVQSEVYNMIFSYAFYGEIGESSGIATAVFTLVKPQIDANNRRRENGSKGGRPTEAKHKPKRNRSKTEPKPNNNLNITEQEPNANQTITEPKPNVNANVNANVNVNANGELIENADRVSPALDEALNEFARMRNTMKAPLTEHAKKLLLTRLDKLAPDTETKVAMLNQSIENGWKGVYPIHDDMQRVGPRSNRRSEELDQMRQMSADWANGG